MRTTSNKQHIFVITRSNQQHETIKGLQRTSNKKQRTIITTSNPKIKQPKAYKHNPKNKWSSSNVSQDEKLIKDVQTESNKRKQSSAWDIIKTTTIKDTQSKLNKNHHHPK